MKAKLKALTKEIDGIKVKMGVLRDDMRNKLDEFEQVYDSLNDGITDIEDGLCAIKIGIDTISEEV